MSQNETTLAEEETRNKISANGLVLAVRKSATNFVLSSANAYFCITWKRFQIHCFKRKFFLDKFTLTIQNAETNMMY